MRRKNNVRIGLEDVLKAGMYNYTQKDLKRLEALKRRENKKQRKHVFIKRVLTAVGISYVLMFNLGDVVQAEALTNEPNVEQVQKSQSSEVQQGQPRESYNQDSQTSQTEEKSDDSNEENSQNNQVSHETQENEKQSNSVSHETKIRVNLHKYMDKYVTVTVNFTHNGKYVATLCHYTINPYQECKKQNNPATFPDDRWYVMHMVTPPKGYTFDGNNQTTMGVIIRYDKGNIIEQNIPIYKKGEKPNKENNSVSHETQENEKQSNKVSHETPNKKQNKQVSHGTNNGGLIPQTGEAKTTLSIIGVGLIGVAVILAGILGIKKNKKGRN